MNSSRHSSKRYGLFETKKPWTNTEIDLKVIDSLPNKQYKFYAGISSNSRQINHEQENNKKTQMLNPIIKMNWKEDIKQREMEIKKKIEEDEAKIDCPICFDQLFSNEKVEDKTPFTFETCVDVFHKGCLRNYLKEEIERKAFPIRCPNAECGKEISDKDIRDTLKVQSELLKKYEDFALDFVLSSNKDYLRCLTPDCAYAFCMNLEDRPQMTCPLCYKTYCMACKVDWHQGMTCKQHEIWRKQEIEELERRGEKMTDTNERFIEFARKSGYKKCPNCGQFNEKISGCNGVSCLRCRVAFCFGCASRVCNCIRN